MTETAHGAVLRVLRDAGQGGVHPSELPALAGRDARQCRRAVAQLIESGLATRNSAHGQIRAAGASPAAEATVSPQLTPAPSPEPARDTGARLADVEPALALMPAEPLRAMARLLLSVIAAETMDTYGRLFPDAEDLDRGAVEAALGNALTEQGRNRSAQ